MVLFWIAYRRFSPTRARKFSRGCSVTAIIGYEITSKRGGFRYVGKLGGFSPMIINRSSFESSIFFFLFGLIISIWITILDEVSISHPVSSFSDDSSSFYLCEYSQENILNPWSSLTVTFLKNRIHFIAMFYSRPWSNQHRSYPTNPNQQPTPR